MSLRSFVRRRGLTWFTCAALVVVAALAHALHTRALGHPAFVSGWVLVAAMLFLTAYNLRKKMDFLPTVWSSRHWLWAHLIVGYASIGVFLIHVGPRLPEGPLEVFLWAQFVAISASGAFGHYISRRFPPLLADRGQEVLYERVPTLIRAERERVEALVLRAAKDGDSTAIPEFYEQQLVDYFSGPRDALAHLLESRRPLERLLRALDGLERLGGKTEREVLDELREVVRAKADIDYHHAHQGLLKLWLLLHVPLAYSLLVVAALHVVLAYAFGGIR